MQNQNVLVIGGAGFLGSHIADSLTEHSYKVTIFDRKESQYLQHNQSQIIGDILDESALDKAVKGKQIVYNIAGIADIGECDNKPLETVKYNILGNAKILNACVENKINKFLFASSAYVYSDSGSFYRISKQSSELLTEGFHDKYGLNYCILRYGTLYGERSDRRNNIYRIIEDALIEHKIIYSGTGKEKREFIHVKDAAELSVNALDDIYTNQNLLLTGESAIIYSDFLNMLKEIFHNKMKIEYKENKSKAHYKLSPYSFNPKLGKKLVNNPHIDLGQGILNLISEIHKNLYPELKEKFGILISEKNTGKLN